MPVIVAAALGVAGIWRVQRLPQTTRFLLGLFVVILVYGLAIGATNKFAAVYEFAGYAGLLAVFIFVRRLDIVPETIDNWIRFLVWAGVAVAAYSWVQFLVVPPWDAKWMVWSEMGSIGKPEPLKVRVFSTLAAPGPAATFLAFALVPAAMLKTWRTRLSWLAPGIILSAFLLTMVRTQWIALAVMLLAWAVLSTGRSRVRLTAIVLLFSGIGFLAVPLMPGGDRIAARMDSFTELEEDRSLQARTEFGKFALASLYSQPLGVGFGTAGSSVRLNSGETLTVVFDNGVLYILTVLGWGFGLVLLIGIVGFSWYLYTLARQTSGTEVAPYAKLAFVLFLGRAASLASGNSFEGDVVLILAALVAAAMVLATSQRVRRFEAVEHNVHRATRNQSRLPVRPLRRPTLRPR